MLNTHESHLVAYSMALNPDQRLQDLDTFDNLEEQSQRRPGCNSGKRSRSFELALASARGGNGRG